MEEKTYSSRRRVNLKKNFKGEIGYEVTVELTDSDNEAVVREAKDIMRRLEQ